MSELLVHLFFEDAVVVSKFGFTLLTVDHSL